MNWDRIAGNWKQAKGKVRRQLDVFASERREDGERRAGPRIPDRQAFARERSAREAQAWESSVRW